jgi:hypothetical protein
LLFAPFKYPSFSFLPLLTSLVTISKVRFSQVVDELRGKLLQHFDILCSFCFSQ